MPKNGILSLTRAFKQIVAYCYSVIFLIRQCTHEVMLKILVTPVKASARRLNSKMV
jgi:hypothetical protein